MRQLLHKLGSGEMTVCEVPAPALLPGRLLVRNAFSLISAGTETSTVRAARKGLAGKARERPEQLRQVMEVLREQGPVQTLRAVRTKLDSYSPLGCSSAGEVMAVGRGSGGFSVGDRVACGGLSASHAEIVLVPEKLCVPVAAAVDLRKAAYNTLGAIALQGVRQAGLQLGETAAVIGLGLLGQLTGQLLRAAGVRVVGIDVHPAAVTAAEGHAADVAFLRESPGLEERVADATAGIGVDAVLITASATSLDPVNLAGSIARPRGRVIIVGDVPTGFDREPHYYQKELELRMARSYGPGRHDPRYEEQGHDYPPAYVRWTENRNMRAFQDLIRTGRIDPSRLTVGEFALEDAPRAYDGLLQGLTSPGGLLIRYQAAPDKASRVELRPPQGSAAVELGFIGAGSYAQGHLLPNLPKGASCARRGVMTARGVSARSAADRFGFDFCTTAATDLFTHPAINTIFIATRHDTHAEYVIEALRRGKHCFVEKPLCLKKEELESVRDAYTKAAEDDRPPLLMVGFNRRFSPLSASLRRRIGTGPHQFLYTVNARPLPPESWILDPETGGGRLLGEICHFIDYFCFLSGARPVRVQAFAAGDAAGKSDGVSVSVGLADGSLGTVVYSDRGARALPKERLEVMGGGSTAVLTDFRELKMYGRGLEYRQKLRAQDKGQRRMVSEFLRAVKNGGPSPISFQEIIASTGATLAAAESLGLGTPLSL